MGSHAKPPGTWRCGWGASARRSTKPTSISSSTTHRPWLHASLPHHAASVRPTGSTSASSICQAAGACVMVRRGMKVRRKPST